jgi:hypothetical protein
MKNTLVMEIETGWQCEGCGELYPDEETPAAFTRDRHPYCADCCEVLSVDPEAN